MPVESVVRVSRTPSRKCQNSGPSHGAAVAGPGLRTLAWLGSEEHRLECADSRDKLPSVACQRNELLSLVPRTEVLPHFLERATEALRRVEGTKAQHWVVPLFHPTVILLDVAVQECAAAMLD